MIGSVDGAAAPASAQRCRATWVRIVTAATMAALALAAAGACTSAPPPPALDPMRPHVDQTHGCISFLGLGKANSGNCLWSVPGSDGHVVLIGDSNAGHFAEGAIAAANSLALDLLLWTSGGCPFVDLYAQAPARIDADVCHAFSADSVAYLVEHKPSLVIIASAASGYLWTGNGYDLRDPATGEVGHLEADKARLWQGGVERIARPLNDAGIPVVIVHTVPRLMGVPTAEDIASCVGFGFVATGCSVINDRSWIEGQQHAALVAEQGALADLPLTIGVDFTDDLCEPAVCSSRMGDHWNYKDGVHLSVDGALMLSGRWREVICGSVASNRCAGSGQRTVDAAKAV